MFHFFLQSSSVDMHCKRKLYRIFLLIYFLTGFILAVFTYNVYIRKRGSTKFRCYMTRFGRFYIGFISLYILLTCMILVSAAICCKQTLIRFRLAPILLMFGILSEFIGLFIIMIIRTTNDFDAKQSTIITLNLLTCYLIVIQIYGVISSLNYHAEIASI